MPPLLCFCRGVHNIDFPPYFGGVPLLQVVWRAVFGGVLVGGGVLYHPPKTFPEGLRGE